MKKINIEIYNEYLESHQTLDFYFTMMFANLDYISIADNNIIYSRNGEIFAIEDDFSVMEFKTFIYEPFIKSLKDVSLIEGELLNEMFNYTYCQTIRASHNNIYVMLHGGSKELFDKPFDDEIINRINKKAYALFESIDNSEDRKIYLELEKQVLQFIKDYKIDG